MNRRGFLGACLALAAAPAIVKASSLMPVRAPRGWVRNPMGGFMLPGQRVYAAEFGDIPAGRIVAATDVPIDFEELIGAFWRDHQMMPTHIYVKDEHIARLARAAAR